MKVWMFLMFGFCVAGCEQRDEVVERKGVEEGEAIDEKVAPVLVDVEILNPVGMGEPTAAWKVACEEDSGLGGASWDYRYS